jgi:hypothetical protein
VRSDGKQTIVPIVVAEGTPAVENVIMTRPTVQRLAGQSDALEATPVDAEGTVLPQAANLVAFDDLGIGGNTIRSVEQETPIADGGTFLWRWPGDVIDFVSERTSTTLTARMVGADMLRVRLPLDGIGEVELDFVKRN